MILTAEEFLDWEGSTNDTIDLKRCYIDMAGDLVAGVLLSQILYWHLPSKHASSKLRVQRDGHWCLAKLQADWWNECRLSSKQVKRAIGILEDKGLIATKNYRFNGLRTQHISLIWEEFLEQWSVALS